MATHRAGAKAALVAIGAALAICAAALATVSALGFQGEPTQGAHFLSGLGEGADGMRALLEHLDAPGNDAAKNFAVAREISNELFRRGEYGRLIHFLGGRANDFPDDPFIAHHLLMMAYAYMRQDSTPIAKRFFELIVNNYPDLEINGSSIHLTCLLQLVELNDDPALQIWYYRELLSRFPDKVEPGVIWFRLAREQERLGDWDGAMQSYGNFLAHGSPTIPGFHGAETYVRHKINFANSARDWTFATLQDLTRAVQNALTNNASVTLRNMQARANFFTRSWGLDDIQSSAPFNVQLFMGGRPIRFTAGLTEGFHELSNENEVFMRTWGWPTVISVWYFYFRRVDFPADPAVHGRWEWVGIYFGEN